MVRMASVKVKYRGALADLTGVDEQNLEVDTVQDIIRHVKAAYGSGAEKKAKAMLIAINGESMLLRGGFKARLAGGETVQFLPLCGGG